MRKIIDAFTIKEFNFWKGILITLISAAFAAGVSYAALQYRISVNAKDLQTTKNEITQKGVQLRKEFEETKTQVKTDSESINTIKQDVGVIKNDVEWIKNHIK